MLINAQDPRQWTYLRNLPKKKKKNPGINQCGEKGDGGGGITYPPDQNQRTISSGYLKISRIKESPQFGWVKKLQKIAGLQTVRGGYHVPIP